MVDPQRDVANWRWDVRGEAFGSDAPAEDPDQDGVALRFDLRFPGQRHDPVSGLNYNYFRDYEPATGRYLQSDPIGLEGGWSTYGYVGGDPVSYVDPFGLVGDPLANYRPVYGPIIIKTPTTPIGWAERLISGYVVGKVTSGTVGVNKYGQLVPKTSSLLGGSLFAVSLISHVEEIGCANMDCDRNGVDDYLERDPNSSFCPVVRPGFYSPSYPISGGR